MMSEMLRESMRGLVALNVLLAAFFFATGYGVAYFTAPRERVVERQPIYYNNTIIENRTVYINDTQIIYVNNTQYIIGLPARVFTLNITLEHITENLTYIVMSSSGKPYVVSLGLCSYGRFNVTELENVTVVLSVSERDKINASLYIHVENYVYSGGWAISGQVVYDGWCELGFFDMDNTIELAVSDRPLSERFIGFGVLFEYIFI